MRRRRRTRAVAADGRPAPAREFSERSGYVAVTGWLNPPAVDVAVETQINIQ